MKADKPALTSGCHHLGLTVRKLEDSARFFTECLGWKEVRRDESYPAIFVSDGSVMVTLWKSKLPDPPVFDKNHVGLHHVAFMVDNAAALEVCYRNIKAYGLTIEFAPELLRGGPAKHMMFYEPGGNRVEIIWPG